MRHRISTRIVVFGALLAGALAPFKLSAQNFVGVGVAREATHAGSAIDENNVLPILSYTTDTFLARTVKGVPEFGISWSFSEKFTISGVLVIENQRRSSDSRTLEVDELTAKDRSLSFGSVLEYRTTIGPAPLELLLRARTRNRDHDGLVIEQRTTIGVYENSVIFAQIFGQLDYFDKDAMRSEFGLNDGRNETLLSSGISQTSFGVQSSFVISNSWSVVLSAERKQLRGDARRSPVSERDNSNEIIAGVTYQF